MLNSAAVRMLESADFSSYVLSGCDLTFMFYVFWDLAVDNSDLQRPKIRC